MDRLGGSDSIKKNGHSENGQPNYGCKKCGRQFAEKPQHKPIQQEEWDLVDKLLLEKIPLAGISRVTDVSEPWIQQYVNKKSRSCLALLIHLRVQQNFK